MRQHLQLTSWGCVCIIAHCGLEALVRSDTPLNESARLSRVAIPLPPARMRCTVLYWASCAPCLRVVVKCKTWC